VDSEQGYPTPCPTANTATGLVTTRTGEEDHTFDFLLSGLDSQEHLDDAALEAYASSVALLSHLHSSPLHRYLLRFPSRVTPRFVELLAAQDPRTLTIMRYYFMLLKTTPHIWWMYGVAEEEFKAVMASCQRNGGRGWIGRSGNSNVKADGNDS